MSTLLGWLPGLPVFMLLLFLIDTSSWTVEERAGILSSISWAVGSVFAYIILGPSRRT